MSLVCFVITMVLWVSLFLYVRQRINALEDKITLLSQLTTTVAGITRTLSEPHEPECSECHESDESDDESTTSDKSDKSDKSNIPPLEELTPLDEAPLHLMMSHFPRMNEMSSMEFKCVMIGEGGMNIVFPEQVHSANAVEIEEILDTEPLPVEPVVLTDLVQHVQDVEDLPKRVVSVDDVHEVKTLNVELNYDSLSVKELKDKVAEMNGPKLKTKKELLEFLKNKM